MIDAALRLTRFSVAKGRPRSKAGFPTLLSKYGFSFGMLGDVHGVPFCWNGPASLLTARRETSRWKLGVEQLLEEESLHSAAHHGSSALVA